jgi:hypothetical protein
MPKTAIAPRPRAIDCATRRTAGPGKIQKAGTNRYMIGEKWSPHAFISGRLTRAPAPRARFQVSWT